MNLKSTVITLEVGQEILIGTDKAIITKMEFHDKSGDLMLNTTKGPLKALNFKVPKSKNNIDKYR